MKDPVRADIAKAVQDSVLSLTGTPIKGISSPPGCGEVEVDDKIVARPAGTNLTIISLRTPAGPRLFEVKFKEVY